MNSVLVIDDLRVVRLSIEAALYRLGYQVKTAEDFISAQNLIKETKFDLIITDILMPQVDGLTVVKWLRSNHPNIKIVAMSGGGSLASAEEALSYATHVVDATIRKPFDADELLAVIKPVLGETV